MEKGRFEGWYFKHQREDDTIALIPGKSKSGAFVQMLLPDGARYFPMPDLRVENGVICTGNCRFSRQGCQIDLPGVSGEIIYGETTPLHSDIMGPFRHLPMECRHGVISMAHSLQGSLCVDGAVHRFDGGTGYVEKDSGTSFPCAYQWLQCNDFPEMCSLMISLATIPFCGMHFTGCICAIVYDGREYRLATYCGVRIRMAEEKRICLSQRALRLVVDIAPSNHAHPLKAPLDGCMNATIRERVNAKVRVRLWEHGQLLFDLRSPHAACEYVPG